MIIGRVAGKSCACSPMAALMRHLAAVAFGVKGSVEVHADRAVDGEQPGGMNDGEFDTDKRWPMDRPEMQVSRLRH